VSKRRRGADDDDFAANLNGVKRIEDRDKIRTPPTDPARQRPARLEEASRFVVDRIGGSVEGRAENVSRKLLTRLRRGAFDPGATLDLHGLPAREARRTLVEQIERARAAGLRCVLVVHGRGLHSEGTAVLREALPTWLQEAPFATRVMAFCTAPARHGGPGAMLVLLRRER